MHAFGDDVTLPFFFIAPPQLLLTETRSFCFWTSNRQYYFFAFFTSQLTSKINIEV